MAFPVDSRYFDRFPLIFGEDEADVADQQHPRNSMPECWESLRNLVTTKYGEKHLEPKTYPHLHHGGYGGWHYKCKLTFATHIKMCLFDMRGWFAEDPLYMFFKFDYMTKHVLHGYASWHTIHCARLTEPVLNHLRGPSWDVRMCMNHWKHFSAAMTDTWGLKPACCLLSTSMATSSYSSFVAEECESNQK